MLPSPLRRRRSRRRAWRRQREGSPRPGRRARLWAQPGRSWQLWRRARRRRRAQLWWWRPWRRRQGEILSGSPSLKGSFVMVHWEEGQKADVSALHWHDGSVPRALLQMLIIWQAPHVGGEKGHSPGIHAELRCGYQFDACSIYYSTGKSCPSLSSSP